MLFRFGLGRVKSTLSPKHNNLHVLLSCRLLLNTPLGHYQTRGGSSSFGVNGQESLREHLSALKLLPSDDWSTINHTTASRRPSHPHPTAGIQKQRSPILGQICLHDVKVAYRKRVIELHPDTNPHPSAAAEFRRATTAYEYLRKIVPTRQVVPPKTSSSSGNGVGSTTSPSSSKENTSAWWRTSSKPSAHERSSASSRSYHPRHQRSTQRSSGARYSSTTSRSTRSREEEEEENNRTGAKRGKGEREFSSSDPNGSGDFPNSTTSTENRTSSSYSTDDSGSKSRGDTAAALNFYEVNMSYYCDPIPFCNRDDEHYHFWLEKAMQPDWDPSKPDN